MPKNFVKLVNESSFFLAGGRSLLEIMFVFNYLKFQAALIAQSLKQ